MEKTQAERLIEGLRIIELGRPVYSDSDHIRQNYPGIRAGDGNYIIAPRKRERLKALGWRWDETFKYWIFKL